MAELAQMNIAVGADLSGLDAAATKGVGSLRFISKAMQDTGKEALAASGKMSQLQKSVAAFGGGASSFNKIPALAASLNLTGGAASEASTALKKVVPGANQASFALNNLGRVAQDAPFGFIGIQNNINPLLESFQRLKAETGSTGGALKALSAGLMGGAGLGLAVSLATGLLTVLAQKGFFNSKKAAEDYKKELSYLKREQNELNEMTQRANKAAGDQFAVVSKLVAVLQLESATIGQKKNALKELQGISATILSSFVLNFSRSEMVFLISFSLMPVRSLILLISSNVIT